MYARRLAVARWYSVRLTEAEAKVSDLPVLHYCDVHPSTVYTDDDADRTPWNHVRMRDVVRATMQARQLLAEAAMPVPDEWGRCGWCGIEESVVWFERGHRRPDGSPVALCSDCGPIFDRRGKSAAFLDDQRLGLVEAITGVPPTLGESAPTGLLAALEAPERGDGSAWSHLPTEAVEALRWDRWGRFNGKHAPEEHRSEAVARARSRERSRAARLAAQESPDLYGFAQTESDGESRE